MATHTCALKLTYFPLKARAEPIRLALTVGKLKFEDERISVEEFFKRKPEFTFGSVPVMEVDGQQFAQSGPMLRYAGKITNLYPQDPLEALKVDQIIAGIEDLQGVLFPVVWESDQANKVAMIDNFMDTAFHRYCTGVESLIEGEWCIGSQMTIADLMVYVLGLTFSEGMFEGIPKDSLKAYKKITQVCKAVGSQPLVKAWNEAH
uniref:Glutathione S-transferase n=1 Tax=Mucochytrium quahogii TaxID=96639 RepID=A0A7S2RA06_9STRA|mmetsp:Transcript_2095/g.3108  ORF Transcript_2095/g.3108 Transcript_2095/m.3108 type:complete len:205 (-) Transcript_2095:1103-1717(-)|eukprot:CAMPEP_0203764940 /NCGR_PEP_ID=MMETSP0098-20131031/18140_1 /ASSEMBLY_ACC=CAM_ASM_000208 /TAXON_ID=96639 /ORGANISM=" , Strain NY0313808BC1" /LENGTH=204 /DNA_ID=CAMNT_0050661143 /DNA_START=3067 /DNA_END=3681 /DNA_ORIENTATION=+